MITKTATSDKLTRSALIMALAVSLAIGSVTTAARTPAAAMEAPPRSHLVIIRTDIDFQPHTRSSFGKLKGYDPAQVTVHVGDRIQWINPDDEIHTATGMGYTGNTVPSSYKFQNDFTKPHGRVIDASEWSTGNLSAHGGKSGIFVAKRTGHYFYACGYHIGLGQIGVIVVEP